MRGPNLNQFQILKQGFQCAPLTYTSGKNQFDTVKEILREFETHDTCLLKGTVGSGKSLVALLIAGHYGGGIGVVPTKALQTQYSRDYAKNGAMQVVGVSVGMIKGRANFKCKRYLPRKCSDKTLPCVRRLGKKESRFEITKDCPHFVYLSASDLSDEKRFKTCVEYDAVSERYGYINLPPVPCDYYKQFLAYAETDVVLLNSAMWHFERMIGRMPKRDYVFIDEIDMFLDSLTLRTSFSQYRLERLEKEGKSVSTEVAIDEFIRLENAYMSLEQDFGLKEDLQKGRVAEFITALTEYLGTIDTEYSLEYLTKIKLLLRFEGACAYIHFPRIEFGVSRPSVVWEGIRESTYGKLLGMSATIQKPAILRDVFGFGEFGTVEGETKIRGKLFVDNSPRLDVNWGSWKSREFRNLYYNALLALVNRAETPAYVQVSAKKYVPDTVNLTEVNTDIAVEEFKRGTRKILWSTKIRRGVDFPKAKSCIVTKFFWPDRGDWMERVMEIKLGKYAYNGYYRDRAHRDFIQAIGRGLRHRDQELHFYSPDITCYRVLQGLKDIFDIVEEQ